MLPEFAFRIEFSGNCPFAARRNWVVRPFRDGATAARSRVQNGERYFPCIGKLKLVFHHGTFFHFAELKFRFGVGDPGQLVGIERQISRGRVPDQAAVRAISFAEFLHRIGAVVLASPPKKRQKNTETEAILHGKRIFVKWIAKLNILHLNDIIAAIKMIKTCFLLGLMGSGKTWWGARLAERLNRPFVDLDVQIESGEGLSINEIFEQVGEPGFRQLEQAYLRRCAAEPALVVATGGGTPCFFNNMAWMNANGITVYLKTPVRVLCNRLLTARETRPLLHGIPEHQLQEHLERLLERREPFYRQAHITLDQTIETDFLTLLEEKIRVFNPE